MNDGNRIDQARPRHLLILCSDLRADSLAGSLRVRSFIKYLQRAGWRLTVVTAAADDGGRDLDLMGALTVKVVPLPADGSRLLKAWTRLTSVPDPFVRWFPNAWPVVSEVVRRDRPDVVLVSSPPHCLQALGVRARREFGIPHVADLRDDWMTNHRQKWPTPWHRRAAARGERECVETAGSILLNTPEVHRRFAARYPARTAAMSTLTNGYDEDDFQVPGPAPAVSNSSLKVYYAGASYGDYMDTQLSGLAEEILEGEGGNGVEMVSLGAGSWRGTGHPPVWRHLGTLPGAGAAREMANADVLLLPMPPGEKEPSGTVPLKAYGYLRSGRSIVYLGERGSTSELLQRFPGTHCLGRAGWMGLGQWLTSHRQQLSQRFVRPGVEEFSFGSLTARLEEKLSQAMAAG